MNLEYMKVIFFLIYFTFLKYKLRTKLGNLTSVYYISLLVLPISIVFYIIFIVD